ncbi:hypothetical protein [Alistipes timonensis]|nr:hypothetical protein [Alistipes timonensis]
MKNKMTFFGAIERNIWGDKINANPYFATLSILAVMLAGAVAGGGRLFYEWFRWDMAMNNVAMAALIVWIWGYNVAESIIAAEDWKVALGRSLLLLPVLILAFVFGAVASVVVICLVILWLALMFISYALTSSGGRSGSRSGGSSSDDDPSIELSTGRKVSGTFAGDDFHGSDGKTYKRTGWGSSDWEKE